MKRIVFVTNIFCKIFNKRDMGPNKLKIYLWCLLLLCPINMWADHDYDADRAVTIRESETLEIKVGEVVDVYADKEGIVNGFYESGMSACWVDHAWVMFLKNNDPHNEYVKVNNTDASIGLSTLVGLKGSSKFMVKMYYSITWMYPGENRKYVAQSEYYFYIKVKDTQPKTISLPKSISMLPGTTSKLEPSITPSNASPTLTWDSSNKDVAIVDDNGNVIAIDSGSSIVSVKTENGLSASCQVNVSGENLTRLNLACTPNSGEIKKGSVVSLNVTNATGANIYYTTNGDIPTIKSIKYNSSGITIKNACTLKAIAYKDGFRPGTITAKYTIIQEPKLTLTASPSSGEVKSGTIVTLTAKSNGNVVYGTNIYYTTNGKNPTTNSSKYTSSGIVIDSDCTLKAIAYKDGYEESNILTQKYTIEKIKVTGITLNLTNVPLKKGETQQLIATVSPSNATNKNVKWTSNKTAVATVSTNGLITAKSLGNATITCKATDGSGKYATCDVTVINERSVAIDEKNFPDKNFRKFLLEQDYGKDGVISEEELRNLTYISVSNCSITNMKGIEFFTSLKDLWCYDNEITSLDLSNNTVLSTVSCKNNKLVTLDVSKNTALRYFDCDKNQLKNLDVSKNLSLISLSCGDNQLVSLDVSKNTTLESLSCYSNQLTSIDVTNNKVLNNLTCSSNPLTTLNLSKNINLSVLYCGSNQLKSLDLSKNTNLEELYCDDNQLTTLNLSNTPSLKRLFCGGNQLTSLDVTNNADLNVLRCWGNQLTTLYLRNREMVYLDVSNNKLKSLDVSNNIKLETLECASNKFTSLDVSRNTDLKEFRCGGNMIKGSAMDALIASLPIRNANDGKVYIVYTSSDEGNVCTKTQVAAIRAKGWIPYSGWGVEYEGSDENTEEKNPDITLLSIKANNPNLTTLSQNDKLILEAVFNNTGSTATIETRVRIWNQDMSPVAYSESQSNEFKANKQTTVKHEYSLLNIPLGNYFATIQFYDHWDSKKWKYYNNRLINFNVTEESEKPDLHFVSVNAINTNLNQLAKDDVLRFSATFKNTGGTATIKTGLLLLDKNTKNIVYKLDVLEKNFPKDEEMTIEYSGSLDGVVAGDYLASVLYYNDWGKEDDKGWYYNMYSLKEITVTNFTDIPQIEKEKYQDKKFYDIYGRRLSVPRKGINIIGGKKILIK